MYYGVRTAVFIAARLQGIAIMRSYTDDCPILLPWIRYSVKEPWRSDYIVSTVRFTICYFGFVFSLQSANKKLPRKIDCHPVLSDGLTRKNLQSGPLIVFVVKSLCAGDSISTRQAQRGANLERYIEFRKTVYLAGKVIVYVDLLGS